jgi:hypothetical protein
VRNNTLCGLLHCKKKRFGICTVSKKSLVDICKNSTGNLFRNLTNVPNIIISFHNKSMINDYGNKLYLFLVFCHVQNINYLLIGGKLMKTKSV